VIPLKFISDGESAHVELKTFFSFLFHVCNRAKKTLRTKVKRWECGTREYLSYEEFCLLGYNDTSVQSENVDFYRTTGRYIPEYRYKHSCENIKSYICWLALRKKH
jgi:hypothetical protein